MNYLEILGTFVGIIYLWIAGLIMPAIYIFVYYDAGLYADFGINIYYLLASIYGIIYWGMGKKKSKDSVKEDIPITYTPKINYIPLILISGFLTIILALILIEFTDSNVPWADSFTTALSIVGMWMLTKKYVEQWLCWIAVDIVCAILYIYKELYFTSALYTLYFVIAYFGFLKWKKMANTKLF